MPKLDFLLKLLLTTFDLLLDALRFIRLSLRPNSALAAENLFLRKSRGMSCDVEVGDSTHSSGSWQPRGPARNCLISIVPGTAGCREAHDGQRRSLAGLRYRSLASGEIRPTQDSFFPDFLSLHH
jgi:hypothetical protein